MKKFNVSIGQVVFTLVIGTICIILGFSAGLEKNLDKDEVAFWEKENTLQKISAIESAHDPNAVSPASARGKWQIMPDTWKECVDLMGVDWEYNSDWNDPIKNKSVGEYYFFTRIPAMLKAYKVPVNIETQLACYNGGIGRVVNAWRTDKRHWKDYLPTETQEYIVKYSKK